MRQIGTFRVKVSSGTDNKKLSDGTVKKYKYGMITIRTPQLTEVIGKNVMIRVFEEDQKKDPR